MAKSKRSIKNRIDHIVGRGYAYGLWQSTIIHTLIFLILALTVIRPSPITPVPVISISFDNSTEINLDQDEGISSLSIASNLLEENASWETGPPIIDEDNEAIVQYETLEDSISSTEYIAHIPNIDVLQENIDKQVIKSDTPIRRSNLPDNESSVSKNKTDNPLLAMIRDGAKLNKNMPTSRGRGAVKERGENNATNIDKRLEHYGAQTGDIQVSLIWNTVDDIDLHVQYYGPGAQTTIFWSNRYAARGMLDIDMNGSGPQSASPIENIFWPFGAAPSGRYVVLVHFFRAWSINRSVPIVVRLKTDKGVLFYNLNLTLHQKQIVVDFTH